MVEIKTGMIKLNFSNYSIWTFRMEDILYFKDLHKPTQGDNARPANKTDKEWDVMHRKSIAYITVD